MNDTDRHLCLWINGWPDWFSPFLTFFSIAMQYIVVKLFFAAMLIGMIIRGGRARVAGLLALLACGVANGSTDILKHTVHMYRPPHFAEMARQMTLRVGFADSMGTASAHAANMAAVATVTTMLLGRWGWPWIAIALLTGISRVYVGAHYPSQVLLGWTCGTVGGLLCATAYRFVTRKRNLSNQPAEE